MTAPATQLDPVIFLDIDGVLNDHRPHKSGYCGTTRRCVGYFNQILRQTPAKIVVSSAWRYLILKGEMTIGGFSSMLLTHGVECHERVIGTTCLDEEIEVRGLQIRHWLNENGGDRRYVVLDDMNLGITDCGHPFVRTMGSIGLNRCDANLAIAILKGERR